ncbi:MAG TPA: xanthine dehydrogenase family protein molybdopterin-binding subunit [Acetobacteraceae bacterium]|jgi:xanthine dehydrogenase YagR molybdenum-binding subunit
MGIIGEPLDRVDGRLKVTGGARYAGEFRVPGMVHATLVQSTIAAGAIAEFDLNAARAMQGVLEIITPDNALKLSTKGGGPQTVKAPLLQDRAIHYNGQHIAIVVADTLDQALAAAARVRVRYHATEPATEMDAVLDRAYPPKQFRNGARPPDSHRGDAAAAFVQGAVKVDATYITPMEHHNPMEPHATIARWDGERLIVWTSTQGISPAQTTLATLFGLDKKQVHVVCPFVGGGFGCKGSTWPPVTLTAMAAKIVQRPVKLVLTRAQMFTSNGYRPRTIQKLKFAADANGRLTSMRHDGFSQMSQPVLGEFSEPVALSTEMLYACDNVSISHRIVPMNTGLPTYMRAPGEASGNFALESAIDELAVALKLDPLEFRLRNYAEQDPHENKPFASKVLRACYQQGSAMFGWARRQPEPRSMRNRSMLVGWGMATGTYPTNQQPAHVRVRIGSDHTIILQSGTQDLGTGTYTVMAQVAAETLSVPFASVRFELGDSRFPPAPVSGGSCTAASVGSAVRAACEAARDRVFDLARRDAQLGWHNLPSSALRMENGDVVGPNARIALAELVRRSGEDAVETTAGAALDDAAKHFSRHAFGAQFAEVQVDPDLGTIRVTRWVGAFDGGRVLNAKTAHSQLIGGITFGIGMALLEETHLDRRSGRIVNANVAEYLLPVNADIPDIRAILVPNDERNSNPLGVKGIGELPMVGVAAAIANAVYHATGKRVRKVPIRIEDVLT